MRNPYLCLGIVTFLGVFALTGLVGIILLAVNDKTAPESLVTTCAMAIGSLASFLVQPPRGSAGTGQPGNPPQVPVVAAR